MNIAVIFVGQFRWFEKGHQTFIENVLPKLQNHNVRYFAHFWDCSECSSENLEKFENIYNPLIWAIERQKSLQQMKSFFKSTNNLSGTMISQSYSFYHAFKFVKQYQQHHKIKFDLFIKLRCDLSFLNEIDLDFDKYSIYTKDLGDWRPSSNYINDYCFFTKNYTNIKKLSKIGFYFDKLTEYPEYFIYQKIPEKGIYCPEEILANHMANNNIKQKSYNFNIDLARHHL